MIQPEYSCYLKTSDGKRGTMLTDVMSIDVTFRWNEVTKWTLSGASLSPCPIGKGAGIIIFRGDTAWLTGFVATIEDSYDTASGIYDWTAEGESDFGKLAHRVIYPDPANADVQTDTETVWSGEGPLSDLLYDLIEHSITNSADLEDRRDTLLATKNAKHLGETVTLTAAYDELLDYVLNQLKDGTLGIRENWNGSTGVTELEFYTPNDVSDTVVFSVEAGSLAGWSRKREAPKGNVILASGAETTNSKGEKTGKWQTVIVSDAESIAEWGRIELRVQHSDITQIIEKDEDGNVTYTEPWSSVLERLRQAAYQDLIDNSAQDGYELTPVDLDRMAYKTHWDLGDTVSVRIAATELKAPIKEIRVRYSGGIETVTPSVGELQKGELQTVFDELGRLKSQVKILNRK